MFWPVLSLLQVHWHISIRSGLAPEKLTPLWKVGCEAAVTRYHLARNCLEMELPSEQMVFTNTKLQSEGKKARSYWKGVKLPGNFLSFAPTNCWKIKRALTSTKALWLSSQVNLTRTIPQSLAHSNLRGKNSLELENKSVYQINTVYKLIWLPDKSKLKTGQEWKVCLKQIRAICKIIHNLNKLCFMTISYANTLKRDSTYNECKLTQRRSRGILKPVSVTFAGIHIKHYILWK